MAELLKVAISPCIDFLGHVGGDDFVLVLRSTDWRERLKRLPAALAMMTFQRPHVIAPQFSNNVMTS